jgi:8-oxo-dGTP diphosphatase
MDHFDIVRQFYRSMNGSDVEAALAFYAEDCITENVLPAAESSGTIAGRDENRRHLESFLDEYGGGWEDGSAYRVRTIGGIETGWGWVHAEWTHRVRRRDSGSVRQFRGHSHFLIEDGRIRRHRSVATEVDPTEAEIESAARSDRHYPSRPVVGVGAVILVRPQDAARAVIALPIPSPQGVVLIKRRFEPLAGQWSLPGGALDVGETLEAGVAREIREETGLIVDVGDVVEVFDRILLDGERKVRYHFVLIDYICRPVGGRLAHASDVSAVVIADPAALEPYALSPKARAVIQKALRASAV